MIIIFIIAGGGISVIIGALLVLIQLRKIGKIVISLGSGMGLIGMMIFILIEMTLISPVNTLSEFVLFMINVLLDLYFLGILMTLIGRKKIKKKQEKELYQKTSDISFLDDEPLLENFDMKNQCTVCKSLNKIDEFYCKNCGTSLNYDIEKFF